MGVDVHGDEGTKAACRAVSDAIRHSSLPLFTEVRAKGGRMLVDVTVGVPDPGKVDVERVKKELPHGEVTVRPVAGGLQVPGADTIIACAAITVSVEYPGEPCDEATGDAPASGSSGCSTWCSGSRRRPQRALLLRRPGLRGEDALSRTPRSCASRAAATTITWASSSSRGVTRPRRGRGAHVPLGVGSGRAHRPGARAAPAHRGAARWSARRITA